MVKTNKLINLKLKSNIIGLKLKSGRNNTGKITVRHKGGGHKKNYRKICFNNFVNNNFTGIVINIEYDPYRNAKIASIYDLFTKNYFYIIAPKGIKIGDIIRSGSTSNIKLGHINSLINLPIGSLIHNVTARNNTNSLYSRSAGSFCVLIEKKNFFAKIKLSSGCYKLLSVNCKASLGIVSNENFFLQTIKKAGRSRWLNRRPKVRGVAMNPIDHPHGGGEGKTSGNKLKLSPWGKPTKKVLIKKRSNINI